MGFWFLMREGRIRFNAMKVNVIQGVRTPVHFVTMGSPISESELRESTASVGAKLIRQVNHPYDPVGDIPRNVAWIAMDGIGGLFRGAAAGAVTGATLGAPLGVLGAAIGGIVGGVGGGLIGAADGLALPAYELLNYHPFETYYNNPEFQIQQIIQKALLENAIKEMNNKGLNDVKN